MECSKCKTVLENDAQYCYLCGSNLSPNAIEDNFIIDKKTSENIYSHPVTPNPPLNNAINNHSKISPMSTAQYIGVFIISLIPIINLYYLIILIIQKNANINKRNLAEAILILIIIFSIVAIILLFLYQLYFPSIFTKISDNKLFV